MANKEKFIEKYDEYFINKYGVDAEYVYAEYYDKVEPYLSLISKFRQKESASFLTEKQVREQLRVGNRCWKAMKHGFKDLASVLRAGENLMKFKSEKDLQRAIQLNPENSKPIEMQLTLYNEDYKPKGKEVQVEMPKTIEIITKSVKKDDKELKQYAPDELG